MKEEEKALGKVTSSWQRQGRYNKVGAPVVEQLHVAKLYLPLLNVDPVIRYQAIHRSCSCGIRTVSALPA